MLSRAQSIRVSNNLEIFLPNMFTEETGFFLLQDIIMKLISIFFTFSFHCKHGESVNLLALIKH